MASLVLGAVATGAAPNPVPSAAQLAWTQHELGIMVSYDMITQLTDVPNPQHFCIGAGGDKNLTVPPASAFNPTDLAAAPAQWMDVAESFGAKYAVYVAMHCSGFAQWPSKIYNYSLAQTALADQDPLAAYFEAAKQRGISPGLYVTWNYNALFNVGEPGGRVQPGPLGPGQRSVTQAEYHDIALEVLSEVYTQYEGRVGEVWFDGGESDPGVSSLMQSTQPQAVYMQGQADDNNARIDGLESGFLSQPVWSRGTAGKNNGGSPLGAHFVPVESDTPISEKDAWFWKPGQRYRPLQELQSVYVNSVGANANLLLGVMPNATGLIGQDQVDLLAQFGAWVKRCYGPGTAAASAGPSVGPSVTLELPTGTVIDRIIVQEDQSAGEQVASFSVEVSPPGGYKTEWIAAGSGESIGHKRIFFLPSGPIAATAVRITVTSTLDGAPAPAQVRWAAAEARSPCQ